MTKFENVNVVKSANVYFDGKVTSRTIEFSDGTNKSLGIMLPGEYKFNTAAAELMEIVSGQLQVLLSDSEKWQPVSGGESFNVPANSSFKVKIERVTDYCCSYLS